MTGPRSASPCQTSPTDHAGKRGTKPAKQLNSPHRRSYKMKCTRRRETPASPPTPGPTIQAKQTEVIALTTKSQRSTGTRETCWTLFSLRRVPPRATYASQHTLPKQQTALSIGALQLPPQQRWTQPSPKFKPSPLPDSPAACPRRLCVWSPAPSAASSLDLR